MLVLTSRDTVISYCNIPQKWSANAENEMRIRRRRRRSKKNNSNNKMVKADIYCLKQHFYVIHAFKNLRTIYPYNSLSLSAKVLTIERGAESETVGKRQAFIKLDHIAVRKKECRMKFHTRERVLGSLLAVHRSLTHIHPTF